MNNKRDENIIKKIGNLGLYLIQGDITQIPTDAIMAAINSNGLWFGKIDGAIQRVAGNQYHLQAVAAMPLSNLQAVVARGSAANHGGKFNDVVFIVDDLQSSLDKVVYSGLEAAHEEGYNQVLIPAIRMRVLAGAVEESPQETIANLGRGIEEFMRNYGQQTRLEKLTVVVHRDQNAVRQSAADWPAFNLLGQKI